MSKIKSGSIVQNPTNLLRGSVIDSLVDRGAQLYSHQQVTFTGSSIIATRPIEIQFQGEDGKFRSNKIRIDQTDLFQSVAGTLPLNNDEVIVARLDRTSSFTVVITAATRASNISTFTTSVSHNLQIGDRVTVSGMTPSSFNGVFYVLTTPAANTFTVANTGIDESATAFDSLVHSDVKLVAAAWSPTEPYLAAGQYSITTLDNLQKIVESSKDIVLLFIRKDTTDLAPTLLIPLHKQLLEAGQTVSLGASGSGDGDGSGLETALRDRFGFLGMKYLDANVFKKDKDTKVDPASTGDYSLLKKAFEFANIGETFVSTNTANAEFLAEGVDITEVELYLHWVLSFIDTGATYQVSRDGGTNWQTVTMARVGTTSSAYRGYHRFTDEVTQQNLQTVAATGAGQALNATTRQELSSQFVVSATGVLRSVDLQLNYGAAGVGNFYVKLVKNNAGVPSTALADLLSESDMISVSGLTSGNSTVTVDMPDVVLVPGTYHLVLATDAAYKAGTLDLSWRSGAGTNGSTFDGTSWTGAASTKAYTAKGRTHDLRVRVTSSAASVYIEGYGLYFGTDDGILAPNGSKNVQRFYFSGDDNRTDFLLNWTPDPDIVELYDAYRGQVYVIDGDEVRISGQTIKFASGTFDFPSEDILLIARQIKGIGIDNSDTNAASISEQSTNLLDLGEQVKDAEYVILPKIAVPFTTIVNRAEIPDLSQDLGVNFGIQRIQTQQMIQLQDEYGPNGEPVFGAVNDKFNQIRFVGSWSNYLGSYGALVFPSTSSDYLEITFYGTGLNALSSLVSATYDIRYSVDGGSETTVPNFLPSGILGNRNYCTNQIIPIVSNLTLGTHTVKIRSNVSPSSLNLAGFEILTETTSLRVNPGSQYVKGKKRTLNTLQTISYNTGFESGVLGTKGGRVLVYQKADGTIAKAVTPTDTTQLNLASASHANEEVARVYRWREFGANRADDFSTLVGTASNRTFTLDDGTTTLAGQNVLRFTNESLSVSSNNDFFTFTFVGTGLDLVETATSNKTYKIVSGLPYGAHTFRMVFNTGPTWTAFIDGISIGVFSTVATQGFLSFVVYQPKTPTLPAGAKLIDAYNLMADYSASVTSTNGEFRSAGVLTKGSSREFVYVGTWSIDSTATGSPISGSLVSSSTATSYMEYAFFGTGVNLLARSGGVASTATIQIDGVAYTGAATAIGTGSSWNAGLSTFTMGAAAQDGTALQISGLSLGVHKIRVTVATNNARIAGLEIITPVHSHADNGPFVLQNTLSVGSYALQDLREFNESDVRSENTTSQAVGITANPTTTSTAFVPVPDLSVTHKSKTGKIRVGYYVGVSHSVANGVVQTQTFINGVGKSPNIGTQVTVIGAWNIIHEFQTYKVGPGTHKIDVHWLQGSGTATATNTRRSITVEDVD